MKAGLRFGLQTRLLSPTMVQCVGEQLFRLFGRRHGGNGFSREQCRKILVVRLDEIGDVILTTGCLRELRRNYPSAHITLIVKPAVRNLVELCPHVDEVLTFDAGHSGGRFNTLLRHSRAIRLVRRSLWGKRFDLTLNPRRAPDYYHANFLTYYSGAPRRVGCGPWPPGTAAQDVVLFTNVVATDAEHEAAHHFEFLRQLGCTVEDESLELWLSDDDRNAATTALRAGGIEFEQPFGVLAPGSGAPKRTWPAERFREIAARIISKTGMKVVIVGGVHERNLSATILEGNENGVVDLVGKLSLRETGALLERSRLFIGNDSGPMHIAAAASAPVVEISSYPSSSSAGHVNAPSRFGPWRVPSIVLQPERPLAPCRTECKAGIAHCIEQITVDRVFESVQQLLAQTESRAGMGSTQASLNANHA